MFIDSEVLILELINDNNLKSYYVINEFDVALCYAICLIGLDRVEQIPEKLTIVQFPHTTQWNRYRFVLHFTGTWDKSARNS